MRGAKFWSDMALNIMINCENEDAQTGAICKSFQKFSIEFTIKLLFTIDYKSMKSSNFEFRSSRLKYLILVLRIQNCTAS